MPAVICTTTGNMTWATYPNSQKNYKGHTSTFGKKETDALNTSLNTTTGHQLSYRPVFCCVCVFSIIFSGIILSRLFSFVSFPHKAAFIIQFFPNCLPRMIFVKGKHKMRITRYTNNMAELMGRVSEIREYSPGKAANINCLPRMIFVPPLHPQQILIQDIQCSQQ